MFSIDITLINDLTNRWGNHRDNLLQILVEVQHHYHYIPENIIDTLASKLAISNNEIIAVIDFYSFLHRQPTAKYSFLFSDNITDQMSGSRELAQRLAAHFSLTINSTDNPEVSVSYTSCTGMSDQGPAGLINAQPLTQLTEQRIDEIARLIKQGTAVAQWPSHFFEVKSNIQRADRLLDTPFQTGSAITTTLTNGSESVLNELKRSDLRGRGGAGFNTSLKWQLCAQASASDRVVVCNADEGEPGTFKDRLLLQQYADTVIEGMTVCALAIGATQGFIYLRGEYRFLLQHLQKVLENRRKQHLLGNNISGKSGTDFDISIHLGAGAYICGEESALIESLEGRRGQPRNRPPFPVTHGYKGLPTVVNNVETFVAAAMIIANGARWFNCCGTKNSSGTKLLSISGDCAKPGIYEFSYGVAISEILQACGAQNTQAVQIAGAAGRTIPPSQFNRTIACEDIASGGSFMIFDHSRDLLSMVDNFCAFFVHESCGFCTPCRVGTTLMHKTIQKFINGHGTQEDINTMRSIALTMKTGSHCGLGATASQAVSDTMDQFFHIYQNRFKHTRFEPAFDLDESLSEARALTGRDDPKSHLEKGGV